MPNIQDPEEYNLVRQMYTQYRRGEVDLDEAVRELKRNKPRKKINDDPR
jgi:ABC-type transporter lipoprotein component MlaA